MKYAKVKYKGAEEKISRFGTVQTGQELELTEAEYECVREDERYEFIEWKKEKLPARNPVGRAINVTLGTTETSPHKEPEAPSEASRVGQDLDGDGIPDHLDPDADGDGIVDADQEGAELEDAEEYENLKVKELQAEVEVRNELLGEDDQIVPASQKKADLIAALEQNDADEAE